MQVSSSSSMTSAASLQSIDPVERTPGERIPGAKLRTDLCHAMRDVAVATGRSQLLSIADLETVADDIAKQLEAVPAGEESQFAASGLARLLLGEAGWNCVNDFLENKGCTLVSDRLDPAPDPLQCDLESWTADATMSPSTVVERAPNWATTLRKYAETTVQSTGTTISLRGLLNVSDGPAILTKLGAVGWHALIGEHGQRNASVVLPLFPDDRQVRFGSPDMPGFNRNGPDAAGVITMIGRATQNVKTVSISAGHGPCDYGEDLRVQKIDLSDVVTPAPTIVIRIKELDTKKVMIFAPEGVDIRVERDMNRQHMSQEFRDKAAPIDDIKLYRTSGRTEKFEFKAAINTYEVRRPREQATSPRHSGEQVLGPDYRQIHRPGDDNHGHAGEPVLGPDYRLISHPDHDKCDNAAASAIGPDPVAVAFDPPVATMAAAELSTAPSPEHHADDNGKEPD